jgi:hypothetical protein
VWVPRSSHRKKSKFVGSLIKVFNPIGGATHDLEMLIASVPRQVEAPCAGIMKEVWVLVALIRHWLNQDLHHGNVHTIMRSSQHNIAGRVS